MSLIYNFIGIGLGILLGTWAFLMAETTNGRIFIVTTMAFIFFLPIVWRHQVSGFVSFFGWVVFAIGCYVFLKWRGVGLR